MKPQTIIQDIGAYQDYTFEAISNKALAVLNSAGTRVGISHQPKISALIRFLECFLQVSGQGVTLTTIRSASFNSICEQFVGALNSDDFASLSISSRYAYCSAFKALLVELRAEFSQVNAEQFSPASTGPTSFVDACKEKYALLQLQEEQVWLWRNWPSTNRVGRVTHFPLYLIYKKLGREFTQRLFEACDQYFSGRKSSRIVGLKELAAFIGEYPRELSPSDFRSSNFITRFWREFLIYYSTTRFAADSNIHTITRDWRNELVTFVEHYLVGNQLFARPFGEFPKAPIKHRPKSHTQIRKLKDGTEIKVKLLTHIPLHITDSQALELLFYQIRRDVGIIKTWANCAVKDIWGRYRRRIVAQSQGQVRLIGGTSEYTRQGWIVDRANPNYFENIAATFAYHGYLTSNDCALTSLYGRDLQQAAHDLGIPTTSSLLPHCALLVAEHPIITPSFLEGLELYNKHGKRTGLKKIDGKYVLIGRKDRKGPVKSQQKVALTGETAKIVLQIIALTNPLRKFLKERGDDKWRRLLLTSGIAFSYPTAVNRIATCTSMASRRAATAQSIQCSANISIGESTDIADRFSLPTLRASAGVLIYLETHDVKKMAEALGHAEYSRSLLSRYLPEPILAFFQERWIRIFQAGILVEALKDSKYLLKATSFASMAELHEFLTNHALRKIPDSFFNQEEKPDKPKDQPGELLIGVSPGILTALASLKIAVSNAHSRPSGKAVYWSEIATQVIDHIESEKCKREDLKGYLTTALQEANPKAMESIIYE
ncbi:hypothetical protein EDC30_103194 [Paucimonas lemoignei]|uniref:Uncharacterized protein n=1 Tax=Paucimonas lemoignei TaxID=29443 RepID=A0A4R3HXJ8_PAULE|nr:hypothetical protein [Paucimonas lemoignei]TCS37902.1 hypothetical protein EDC30_103194 [Paucimonas lemoignei]